jgi:hypothetical protein
MNDKDQREEDEMILPGGMLAELGTRAARRGCTIETLIDEAHERTMRMPRLQHDALLLRAKAIDEALALGKPPPWPASFNECLAVGLALAVFIKNDSEDYLLEANGEEMDVLDAICRPAWHSFRYR